MVLDIYRDAKRRGVYLALFVDSEGESCLSSYQIIWMKVKKVTFCQLKTSLSRNFVYHSQTFRDIVKSIFTILLQIRHGIIFHLPVNTDKPKVVSFLVFICTTPSFIAQISSSENVLKRDAILAPVAKQWIAKDILSYGSQSKRAKIAIYWFGKY